MKKLLWVDNADEAQKALVLLFFSRLSWNHGSAVMDSIPGGIHTHKAA